MIDETTVRELVAVGCNGYQFRQYAASQLLQLANCYSGCRYEILLSMIARGFHEWPNVLQMLTDWRAQERNPARMVYKFVPGDHYHVGDSKFATLAEAQKHLSKLGYGYAGLEERHVYATDGD